MPTETPDSEPETYTCPFCSLKVVLHRTQMVGERNERILSLGHVEPVCSGFRALEDPDDYLEDARAGVVHWANDG